MYIVLGFITLIGIGVPVGFSMIIASFVYLLFTGSAEITMIPQAMISGVSSYTMLAVPFFMLVGELMNSSGITERIFNFARCMVGHITGGLAHVNILASMLFAGLSGAAVADAAGLGPIEIKAMTDDGFDIDFSAGVTAASSIIGPIIPPSSPMVLLGVTAGISIGSLFMGGITVGIIMGLLMMITVYFIAKKRNYPVRKRASLNELFKAFISALPAIISPFIILAGILGGLSTPTEAAAISLVYTLLLGFFIYKELTISRLIKVLKNGVENLGMIMLLMSSGKIFAWVLGLEKIADKLTQNLFSITDNAWIIILLMNLLFLFMGTFMETNASIIILTPILLPIANIIGMDYVHFGVVMIFALMIGLLTPPMAIILFITSKIANISFERTFKAVTPYYIGLLVVLVLINIFPSIVLAIPKLILGKAF